MKEKKKIPGNMTPARPFNPLGTFPYDPLGSYTGVPVIPGEVPVQDADDL